MMTTKRIKRRRSTTIKDWFTFRTRLYLFLIVLLIVLFYFILIGKGAVMVTEMVTVIVSVIVSRIKTEKLLVYA